MKRTKPMRRTPIRRRWEGPTTETELRQMAKLERPVVYGPAELSAAPKAEPVRHEGYRRLVASLPCAHCFVFGYSQAAHGDQGKGMGIKSDDRTCYPACGPHDGSPGCHWFIGTSGQIPREIRRAMERDYAARTRATIINLGRWPADLPIWNEK